MNKRTCINMSGLMEYEIEMTKKMTVIIHRTPEEVIAKYSPRERWKYCSFHCPISQRCKFENRYRLNRNE